MAAFAIPIAISGGPGASATTPSAAKTSSHIAYKTYGETCFLNADGVRYRTGPGTNYRALGHVNRGQGFDVINWVAPRDGGIKPWGKGNLWGGPQGVYIRYDFLKCH